MMHRRLTMISLLLASLLGLVWQGCVSDGQLYPCGFDANNQEILCCPMWTAACMDPEVHARLPGRCDPCLYPDAGAPDSGTDAADDAEGGPPGGDAGTDAADGAAAVCSGACVEAPPLGWSEPTLLWKGAIGSTPPACPAEAPVIGFQGFADLVVPPASCGACSCDAATATCGITSSYTASSVACGATGVTSSFDAPASWDGTCTNDGAFAAGQLCGTTTCAKSLTAGALTVQNEGCAAVTAPPPIPTPPATWQTAVLACKRGSAVPCDDPGQVCAPVAVPPQGFTLCVYQDGDLDCPASFPNKLGVATGFDDQRGCSACTCGSPAGGLCVATLNVFTDNACTAPLLSIPISSTGPACVDLVPPGPALGSKTVEKLKYLHGDCAAAGGDPMGDAVPTGAATFCCAG